MIYDFPKYPSIKIGATDLGIEPEALRALQRLPAPGFKSGRVDTRQLLAFLLGAGSKPETGDDSVAAWRKRLIAAQAKREELRHGLESGELVRRAAINERFQRLGGEVQGIRVLSEAEDPLRFAAAGGDVALCRTHVRAMWDKILTEFQATSHHLEGL